jgi:hypothetical protein
MCQTLAPDQEGGSTSAEWRVPRPAPTPAKDADGDRLSRNGPAADGLGFGNRLGREREAAFWESVGMLCRGESVWCPAAISFTCRTGAEELE